MQVTANPKTKVCQERRQEKSSLLKRWLRVLGGVIAWTKRERGKTLQGMWHRLDSSKWEESEGCDCEIRVIERLNGEVSGFAYLSWVWCWNFDNMGDGEGTVDGEPQQCAMH